MAKEPEIPDQYQTVMPYLIIRNAVSFSEFTEKVFGAKETFKTMKDPQTVGHAEIMIGQSTIMFAEATDIHNPQPAGLFVYVADADETYNLALNSGAKAVTTLSDQPYGRSGGVADPFGNTWWITSVKKG